MGILLNQERIRRLNRAGLDHLQISIDNVLPDDLDRLVALGGSTFDFANYNRFQKNLANGRPNDWHCGAGCLYLYVCEDGLVHWCSQQRGYPGIPLEQDGSYDLRRESRNVKSCAPFCTVGCVHRVAQLDELRRNPQTVLAQWFPAAPGGRPTTPISVRMLSWAFVTGSPRNLLRHAASRIIGRPRFDEPSRPSPGNP